MFGKQVILVVILPPKKIKKRKEMTDGGMEQDLQMAWQSRTQINGICGVW